MTSNARAASMALLLVFVCWLPSAALRLADADEGVRNHEANFHVLLTLEALEGNPIGETYLLPTVTLPGAQNAEIAWGAAERTSDGQYIYTSFPPLGFLAPLAVFEAVGVSSSLQHLRFFTIGLGLLSVLLLQWLLWRVLADRSPRRQLLLLTTGLSVAAIYTNEVLVAGGLVYWGQALVQPLLLVTLLLLHTCLRRKHVDLRRGVALSVLVFIMCLCEWTGATFGLGGGLLLLALARLDNGYVRVSRNLAWILVTPVFVALVVFVTQLAFAIGLADALNAMARRAVARSATSPALPLELALGYISSFGLLLAVGLSAIIVVARRMWRARNERIAGLDADLLILALSMVPLSENLVMMQHASQFTFDRYKAVIPLIIAAGLWLSTIRWSARTVVAGAVVIAGSIYVGLAQYAADQRAHASWAGIDASNRQIIEHLKGVTDVGCAAIASSGAVRGYDNLLLGRGIHESLTLNEAMAELRPPGGCDLVFIEVVKPFSDLSAVRRIVVVDAFGGTQVLLP